MDVGVGEAGQLADLERGNAAAVDGSGFDCGQEQPRGGGAGTERDDHGVAGWFLEGSESCQEQPRQLRIVEGRQAAGRVRAQIAFIEHLAQEGLELGSPRFDQHAQRVAPRGRIRPSSGGNSKQIGQRAAVAKDDSQFTDEPLHVVVGAGGEVRLGGLPRRGRGAFRQPRRAWAMPLKIAWVWGAFAVRPARATNLSTGWGESWRFSVNRRATQRTSGNIRLDSMSPIARSGFSGTAGSMPYQIINGSTRSVAKSFLAANASASGQRSAGGSSCSAEDRYKRTSPDESRAASAGKSRTDCGAGILPSPSSRIAHTRTCSSR